MNRTSPLRPYLRRHARILVGSTGLALLGLALSTTGAHAQTLPTGGAVSAGSASIASTASTVTVTQTSASAAINWQGFSIGKGGSVVFVQPNSSSVALNRVTGADPSVILGSLSANGKVFLINPNGILFGQGSSVNVGGLVASTLNLSDADFMAGKYSFAGTGGSVVNQGTITADGGYVALLGASVSNLGVIQANLGTVALAAGNAITLDVAGDGLLSVAIDSGAVNALVANGGMIRANGGTVLLTAQAAGALLHTVVNNTGVIEAQTIGTHNGTISLLGDMQTGTVNAAGTLDASAPNGGNGGAIETSAATVNVDSAAVITTAAPYGTTGTWLIDPTDFTIGTGGNISGATLSALLVTNSVTISTLDGVAAGTTAGTPPVTTETSAVAGNGDINVNEAVSWTASSTATTLTFNALRDVNVNAPITATNGNVVVCCGRDANINAPITTTNGSILLSAGNDVNVNAAGANTVDPTQVGVLTVTDGNLTLCAGLDVLIAGAITLTRGTTIPAQSLGLTSGLTIITGNNGTGPGVAGGTLTFAPLTPPVAITDAAVTINYNPVSYATPTDYSVNFTLSPGSSLTEHMLVFPTVDKLYDGTTATLLTGLASTAASGVPTGVTLVAGPNATATFDSADPGTAIGITYAGYTLTGADAALYALAVSCCNKPTRTTGTITAAPTTTTTVVTTVGTTTVGTTPVVTTTVGTTPVTVTAVSPGLVVVAPAVTSPNLAPGSGTELTEVGSGVPLIALSAAPSVVIAGGGLNLAAYQLTSLVQPVAPTPETARSSVLSELVAPAPHIYPRKQDRN